MICIIVGALRNLLEHLSWLLSSPNPSRDHLLPYEVAIEPTSEVEWALKKLSQQIRVTNAAIEHFKRQKMSSPTGQ